VGDWNPVARALAHGQVTRSEAIWRSRWLLLMRLEDERILNKRRRARSKTTLV
jgi:hypothetical protein